MNERDDEGSLKQLNERLEAARSRRDADDKKSKRRKRGGELGPAMRVGIDLVSGIIVGVLIGLGLDRWLGTGPWLMLVFFLFGSAAGITNVMRTARKMEADAAAQRGDRSTGGNTPAVTEDRTGRPQ